MGNTKQSARHRSKKERACKKNLTEIVFILDRSGSMSGLESDTIGGFNGMLKKQKGEEGDALVSVVLFDDVSEVICDRVDIKEMKPLSEDDYYVRGCTALLDAVGKAIHHIGNVHKYAREEDRPNKTLFIITTDGMENSSKEYSYDRVRRMIEKEKEKYGWEFIFLGANMDAIQLAGRFGVDRNRVARFGNDCVGIELNYQVVTQMVSKVRKSESISAMKNELDADDGLCQIQNDYDELSEFEKQKHQYSRYLKYSNIMEAYLQNLTPREQKIAIKLFGLKGERVHSYKEIEQEFGIPQGRVRQIESGIIRRMKVRDNAAWH